MRNGLVAMLNLIRAFSILHLSESFCSLQAFQAYWPI